MSTCLSFWKESLKTGKRNHTFLETPDVEVDLLGELVLQEVPLVLRAVVPFGAGVHRRHVVHRVQPTVWAKTRY